MSDIKRINEAIKAIRLEIEDAELTNSGEYKVGLLDGLTIGLETLCELEREHYNKRQD